MDLMTAIAAIPGIGPALPYIMALGLICAAASTVMPPPTGSGWYVGLYKIVNFIGMNFGHARNATAPASVAQGEPK